MAEVRSMPCSSCPYRCDVPSGLWERSEYAKLLPYDEPTESQPLQAFACHATPDHLCHGWAVCHSNRGPGFELLSLRMERVGHVPDPVTPLFGSASEAAEHGLRDVDEPSTVAVEAAQRLMSKYEHLR